MTLREYVKRLQRALNTAGVKPPFDETGQFGPRTKLESDKYDVVVTVQKKSIPVARSENPAYLEAKKYEGKKETDKTFGAWLSGFWSKVKLPGYKTIIGTSFAWCGLFIFAMNTQVGQKAISGAAGAKNWSKYGVEIDWKKDGIPKGAVVHINHDAKCSSTSSNHVTFADGDCSAQDIAKPGATFPGFGGNQSDQVKRSIFKVATICEVRWPSEIPKPGPVPASINCSGNSSGDTTR